MSQNNVDRLHKYVNISIIGVLVIVIGYTIAREKVITEKAYEEGDQEGSQHTAELLNVLAQSTEITNEQAVQWWVGTKDMVAVRNRLCGNFKPKKEGK